MNLYSQFSSQGKNAIWSSPELNEIYSEKSQFSKKTSPELKKKKPQSQFSKDKVNYFSPEDIKKAKKYVEEFKKEYPNVNFQRNSNPNNESIYRLT